MSLFNLQTGGIIMFSFNTMAYIPTHFPTSFWSAVVHFSDISNTEKKEPITSNIFFLQKIHFNFNEMWFNVAILAVFYSNLKENWASKPLVINGLFSEFSNLGLQHHIWLNICCTYLPNVFFNINLHQNENTWATN